MTTTKRIPKRFRRLVETVTAAEKAGVFKGAWADFIAEELAEINGDAEETEEEAPDMSCDQCQALMIQGVYCHETGCQNTRKVKIDGEWVTVPPEDMDY